MRSHRFLPTIVTVLCAASSLSAFASCSDDSSQATNTTVPDAAGSDTSMPNPDTDAADEPPGPQDGSWTFTTLKEETVKVNGADVKLEFLRADRPDGRRTYLLYQHALTAKAPLVIFNEPYAAIDWSGDEVDTRWAAGGIGQRPDVDAPGYNDKDLVAYAPQTPQAAVEASLPWAFNGYGTIRPYGRYYAGGSLEDDMLDAVAPYFFARTRKEEIDTTRIGSIGASWGGMMALFGASHSPKDTPPRAVVAMSAPSDFADLWTWSQSTLPPAYPKPDEVATFYSPYWRRITQTTGAPPSGPPALPYSRAGLCPNKLRGHVLIPHDTWDLLIPVTQTQALAAACPNVEPLYWPRAPIDYKTAKFDHGPAPSEGALPSMISFSYAYIMEQLAPEGATKIYSTVSRPSLVIHLNLIVTAQRAGQDVSYILPRLRELADPRLVLFEAEGGAQTPGAKIVAGAVNDAWKTAFDENTIRTQLAAGLPPPP